MSTVTAESNTMQGLVKYHGMRDPDLRIPYHDSISVNTTCFSSKNTVSFQDGKSAVFVEGEKNADAERRVDPLLRKLCGKSFEELRMRIDGWNTAGIDGKGLGFSSSAGAAVALACHRALVGVDPDYKELSKVARLFAASASRSLVGGFSRLHVGSGDEDTYAEQFADGTDLDLRMVIVPLPSSVRTEEAHREVLTSPFFNARIDSARKRCDEMERAIRGGDFRTMAELTEQDTLELHALTMTGTNRMLILSADSINIITKVKELRSNSIEAYFSLQTGPSVFINTTEEDVGKVRRAISKMGYKTFVSGVGRKARIVPNPKSRHA